MWTRIRYATNGSRGVKHVRLTRCTIYSFNDDAEVWRTGGACCNFAKQLFSLVTFFYTALRCIGVASGGPKGPCPPKIFRTYSHLYFERRFSKQNSVIRLKSNILPPKIFGLATPLLRYRLSKGRLIKAAMDVLSRRKTWCFSTLLLQARSLLAQWYRNRWTIAQKLNAEKGIQHTQAGRCDLTASRCYRGDRKTEASQQQFYAYWKKKQMQHCVLWHNYLMEVNPTRANWDHN